MKPAIFSVNTGSTAALAAAAAPDHARGRYLAVFQNSFTFASIAGPVFFPSLSGIGRAAPWIVLGILDCASAVAIATLERRLPEKALR